MVASLVESCLALKAEAGFMLNPTWYLALAFGFAVIPLLLGLATSFVKISIVLGMIRNALGTQHAPGGMVTLALSLALTAYCMEPVFSRTFEQADRIGLSALLQHSKLPSANQIEPVLEPWRIFLTANAGKRELLLLSKINSKPKGEPVQEQAQEPAQHPEWRILLPAFLLTELKEGFSMGFIVLLPFLVIDLIVANILMGLGMMMVSPVLISLPLKLLLFVVSDAWLLLTQGLVNSYQV